MLAVGNTGSCFGPQNNIGHPARRYKQQQQNTSAGSRVECPRNINGLQNMCY